MTYISKTTAVLALAVLVSMISSNDAMAQANVLKSEGTFSGATIMANPCTSELVSFTYTVDWQLHRVINNNGVHYHYTYVYKFEGVGLTTQNRYHATWTYSYNYNNQTHPGANYSYHYNRNIISQGSSSNWMVSSNYHYTYNANGDPTSVNSDFTNSCQ